MIMETVEINTGGSRQGKDAGAIDWEQAAARWDARLAGALALAL